MISASAKDLTYQAINQELDSIIEKYGFFHSHHEFYGVLLEELEETQDNELLIKNLVSILWESIRRDDKQNTVINALEIQRLALQNALEWIQVCAVIDKFYIREVTRNVDKDLQSDLR